MDFGAIVKVLGYLLLIEAGLMVPSLLVALYYNGPDKMGILISIFITLIVGFIMSRVSKYRDEDIQGKEGLAMVGLGWLLVSVFGALPFVLTDVIPSWIDAFFETVSGFTTTGASVVNDIESFPKGVLFWRSFTHWIGGMGILVFTVAILPMLGLGGFQVYKIESTGPMADRIVPRVRDTAKILYTIYLTFTVIEIIFLMLGGMSLYDSALHTFGTVGTGGFGIKANSVGYYNSTYIHLLIGTFMIMCGINFSLYYSLFKGKWKEILKNQELRLYLSIVVVSVLLIAFNIYKHMGYNSLGLALRDSYFQVGSIVTTTGYSTVDFDQWPTFSKLILFTLMFLGGCAGSTAGGIKIVRILILIRAIKREFYKILHPRAVIPIKINDRAISSNTVTGIAAFFMLYSVLFILGSIIISLDGVDFESAITAVVASLSNIGPAFGFAGPARTYAEFSNLSKLFMTGFMLLGRLELFPLIILLNPSIWKSENFIKHR
ncbi:MAG: TrkH family potassium uptake protein [Tissierellia bacterium]|nr:TrkH family potassium uptake protein [Tissierellia bacterium]